METQSIIIPDLTSAMVAINEMAERSSWFCFEPYPDEQYRLEFKAGEGHYEFLDDFLGGKFISEDRECEMSRNLVIWVRCGNEDGYHKFDSIEDAAEYVGSFSTSPVSRCCDYGISSDEFSGRNYISIFWGENNETADPFRELTDEEIENVNDSLSAIEWSERCSES